VEHRRAERIGQLLRLAGIGDEGEGVVEHVEGNARLAQLAGQPGVAVEVDLQPERCPGRNADVTEPDLLIDEVEVVVQAFAGGGFEKGAMGGLVVPRSVRRTGLHGRENVHQPGVIAALGEDLLDARLLAERLELADKLNLQSRLGGDPLRVVAQLLAQRLGPAGKVFRQRIKTLQGRISCRGGRLLRASLGES